MKSTTGIAPHTACPDQHLCDECARELVRDLHQPNPATFWVDLLATAAVGHLALFAAIFATQTFSAAMYVAIAVAAAALYRGLCFLHEVTHIRRQLLPGFEFGWNLVFGVPMLLPAFMYVGVHQDHHKLNSYGTLQDPEYLPFTSKLVIPVFFLLHSVLIPFFLLLRFLVIAPVTLVFPFLRRKVAIHASSLVMNVQYQRSIDDGLIRRMQIWELIVLTAWGCAAAAVFAGILPVKAIAIWYSVMALIAVVNALRTLGAHHYESDGGQMSRTEQLLDSVDHPGGPWTELWAPVGLRYHALHHYFPGIPYHNLKEAHRRLAERLPEHAAYRDTISASLFHSLGRLFSTAAHPSNLSGESQIHAASSSPAVTPQSPSRT